MSPGCCCSGGDDSQRHESELDWVQLLFTTSRHHRLAEWVGILDWVQLLFKLRKVVSFFSLQQESEALWLWLPPLSSPRLSLMF